MNKLINTLLTNELIPRLKKRKLNIKDSPVSSEQLAIIANLKDSGEIDHGRTRAIFDIIFEDYDKKS